MRIARPHYAYAGFGVTEPIDTFPELQLVGESANVPAVNASWHSHSVFEFVYTMRGVSSLELADRTLMVQPGEMTITYPDEMHSVNGETRVKNQFLWVRLDLPKLGPAGEALHGRLQRKPLNLLRGAYDLEPAMRALLRQVLRREPGFERVARAQVQVILALLLQRVSAGGHIPGPRLSRRLPTAVAERARPVMTPFPNDHPYSVEIAAAIRYMEQRLDVRLSTREIAEQAQLSPSHLYHRFRREVGLSPHAWHLDLRLNAAKDALTHPDLSVVAVSQMYGFSSGQHFSTAFANAFGVSPSAWRQQKRGVKKGVKGV